jgi:hypothetical protein
MALPSGLSCLICCELYTDPVVWGTSGITYCSACIEQWLGRGNSTCPATNQRASAADIRPNYALREVLQHVGAGQRQGPGLLGPDAQRGANPTSLPSTPSPGAVMQEQTKAAPVKAMQQRQVLRVASSDDQRLQAAVASAPVSDKTGEAQGAACGAWCDAAWWCDGYGVYQLLAGRTALADP